LPLISFKQTVFRPWFSDDASAARQGFGVKNAIWVPGLYLDSELLLQSGIYKILKLYQYIMSEDKKRDYGVALTIMSKK